MTEKNNENIKSNSSLKIAIDHDISDNIDYFVFYGQFSNKT